MENQATLTLCATTGKVLTETVEGVTMPADYSFASVNDYVHGMERNFEELQWLALGMATEIDKLRKDAERYCWLMQDDGHNALMATLASLCANDDPIKPQMDAAIDAAMAKTPNLNSTT